MSTARDSEQRLPLFSTGAAAPPDVGQFHSLLPFVYPPVTGLSQPLLLLTVFCGSVFLILNKTKSWQLFEIVSVQWELRASRTSTDEILFSGSGT